MAIPNLPTDNLYKFLALSGVAIIITCSILFLNQYNSIISQIDRTTIESTELEIELTFLEKDSKLLKEELDISKREDKFKNSFNSDNKLSINFSKLEEKIRTNKSLRDYYEFILKYKKYFLPYLLKAEKLEEETKRLDDLLRKISSKNKLIRSKYEIIKSKKKDLQFNLTFLSIFIFIGSNIAFYGFFKWNLLQKLIDKKIEIELSQMKEKSPY